MSVVLLVRHGQASWGADDYDQLSDRGFEQSRVLGSALASRGVSADRVVTGRMRRHTQTAESAGAAAGWSAVPEVDPGWDEFDHVQALAVHEQPQTDSAELSARDFQAWFEAALARWASGDYDAEYDEPFHVFSARVEAALQRATAGLDQGATTVIFTSGGPVSWVVAALLGVGARGWAQLNPVVVNGSLTKLVVGRRGTTLVTFNEHGHLEPGLVTYR